VPSPPAPTESLIFGVNIHTGSDATTNTQRASIMKQRNLKTARMDLWAGDVTAFRDQVNKIRANGGKVEVSLQINYQWNNSCPQNFASVEQDAYNQTVNLVNQVKDIVHDFELLNEVQLRPDILPEVPFNSAMGSTTPYQGKPCVATMTSVLRGMSRAIHDVGASSGLPLKVILGLVGRDWGFLSYMRQQGVQWDITGYHIYPRQEHASLLSDPWFGAGGPLAQLAAFGKPVRINEFHCGEIYDGGYENQAGMPTTEKCLKGVTKHLKDLRNQKIANIESIHIYELLDEPSKPAPENHFGLMYNLSQPKVHTYLAAAFAGGTLTTAERNEITSRGLLTSAEIDAMQQGASTPAPQPPAPATPSAHGATIPPSTSLADATGAAWTVVNGVIYRNGTATVSSSVTLLLYWNNVIYQQNSAGGWWLWANNSWQATTDPRVTTAPSEPAPAPGTDATVPSVAITSPAQGATFNRRSTLTVQASASDNVGVARVSFYLNGSLVCTDSAAPYSCTMTLPGARHATHRIEARAQDAAGNEGRATASVSTP
jgi:Bacterial Ig domain